MAVFSETAAGHESMLTLTADADFNGEKEVVIHDYMPRQEYVKDGLVLWLDGLDNAGQTMELKQGANSLRLRTDFANVFDTTSAITFRKNGESAWYADAEKKNTFVSGNNAAYDRARYYGEEMTAPEVKLNGTELSEEGTTTVTARFENGVAVIPVESTQTGSVPMKITVDGRTCETVLVTNDVVDLAVRDIPDSVHLTGVSETAAVSVIRAMLKEQVEAALADTFFAEDGGSVSVSGTESPYRVDLTLGDQTKTKSVAVTIEYADSTDMDILKRAMAKIMQGEFSFKTAEEVTAEALQQQITEKLDSGITASVV